MSWGNSTDSYKINDEESLERDQYLGLIGDGTAKPKDPKQYAELLEEVEKEKKSLLEVEVESAAILKKEQLENELNLLYSDVVQKEAELSGVVLEPEQVLEMVEDLKKRILPKKKGFFS